MNEIAMGVLMVELRAQSGNLIAEFQKASQAVAVQTNSMSAKVGAFEKGLLISGAAITAAVAGISAVSIKEFAKFDEAMLKSVVNMKGVTAEMRQQLETAARSFAIAQGEDADDIARSYLTLSKAGYTVADSIKALTQVEAFGQVTELSMNESAKVLTGTVKALGLASADSATKMEALGHVSDVLIAASQQTSASYGELASAIEGRFGIALRSTHKSIEEGVAALMTLSETGIRGSMAGMMLSTAFKEMQKSAVDNKETWDMFGLSVFNATGKMLPLADIVEQLEGKLEGASDEQKKMTLELLGFSSRSVEAIQSLIGMSGKLREYETNLLAAKGTTKTAADTLSESYTEMWKQIQAAFREVLLLIGQELMPIFEGVTKVLRDMATNTGEWKGSIESCAEVIRTVLYDAVWLVSNVLQGWLVIVKGVQLAALHISKALFTPSKEEMARMKKGEQLPAPMGVQMAWMFGASDETSQELLNMGMSIEQVLEQTQAEMDKLLLEKSVWDKLRDAMNEAAEARRVKTEADKKAKAETEAIAAANAKEAETQKRVNAELDKYFGEIDRINKTAAHITYTKNSPEVVQLKLAIKDPWEEGMKTKKKYDDMLASGAIAESEYARALSALNLKGDLTDPFEAAIQKIEQYKRAFDDGVINQSEYIRGMNTQLSSAAPDTFGPKTFGREEAKQIGSMNYKTGIDEVDQISALQQQEQDMMDSYDRRREILENWNAEEVGMEREKQTMLTNMQKQALQMQEMYARQRNQVLLQSMSSSFDQMATVMGQAFGEQSGAYKTMFAVSKAFSIAEALIKIQLGIAEAASLPWPSNLAAMASTMAATASLITNISSVVLSFEGGGDTPDGPRSGGVDGHGGFYAIMHPNETVTDNTLSPSSNRGTTVNVHNYAGASVETQTGADGSLDVIIRQIDQIMSKNIRDRRGALPKALEGTYNTLRRGNGSGRNSI